MKISDLTLGATIYKVAYGSIKKAGIRELSYKGFEFAWEGVGTSMYVDYKFYGITSESEFPVKLDNTYYLCYDRESAEEIAIKQLTHIIDSKLQAITTLHAEIADLTQNIDNIKLST